MLNVVLLNVVMLSVVMLNVIMLNVILLNVVMLNVIMLCVMLSVVLLNVVMLNVVMLNVAAPFCDTTEKNVKNMTPELIFKKLITIIFNTWSPYSRVVTVKRSDHTCDNAPLCALYSSLDKL